MGTGKRSSERALQKVLGKGANVNEANPLEVHDPKVGSLISYEGLTTADGAADGSTLIDSVLTTKPNFEGSLVIVTSGAYAGQGRDLIGVTTGGTVTPHLAFGGQILSGTNFVIVALRLTPAEVAALTALVNNLLADVGDASAATLGSIFGILGDPAQSFLAMIGYEGATSLANKLTAARALLLDQITALRMAELDPAGLPADVAANAAQLVLALADTAALLVDTAAILVDTTAIEAAVGAIEGATSLHNKLTALRAGYLDNLSAGAAALEATLTAIKGAGWSDENLTTIDSLIDTLLTRVTAAVALASVCTEARLAELDAANLPTTTDNILLDTQIRRVASGSSGVIATTASKYIEIDSDENGAEILAVIINGVVTGFDWTLDIYVPTADAVAAPAAADKRDSIAYIAADTEGGLLKPFAIAYNAFLKFTNDSAGNQTINDVVVVYRSRAAVTIGAWT